VRERGYGVDIGSRSPARCVHNTDTHVSNGRSVTSVVCYCSFQFHLMPFVPFWSSSHCAHWNSNHGHHVPSPYILGPSITDHVRHKIASCVLWALPPSCHHSTLLSSSPPWSSSPLILFFNLRSVSCGLPSLTDPIPLSPHIYRSSLAPPNACPSAEIPDPILVSPSTGPL
jgi:hypothetical protein